MGGGMSIRTAKRGRTERGASLVEFAFIAPVLFLLLLGTITGGLTLSRQNSIENAVREGTRFGAVNPIGANVDDYLREVIEQTRGGATGDLGRLGANLPGQLICAAAVYETTASPPMIKTRSITESADTQTPSDTLCFADGRPVNELRVQVMAKRTSDIQAILYTQTVELESRSATRYER